MERVTVHSVVEAYESVYAATAKLQLEIQNYQQQKAERQKPRTTMHKIQDNLVERLRRGKERPGQSILQAAVSLGNYMGMAQSEEYIFGLVLSETILLDKKNRERIPEIINGGNTFDFPLAHPLKNAQISIASSLYVLGKQFGLERMQQIAHIGYAAGNDFLHPAPRTKEFLGNTIMNYFHQLR